MTNRNASQRFWEKVEKTDACWIWMASKDAYGYGQFHLDGTMRKAHRVAYTWAYGAIPVDAMLDHVCHRRECVNPAHMRLSTSAQNNQNLQGARSGSKSGVRGVSWSKARKCWRAEASVDGKRFHIGIFADLHAAEEAATSWRREHMPRSVMDQKKEYRP